MGKNSSHWAMLRLAGTLLIWLCAFFMPQASNADRFVTSLDLRLICNLTETFQTTFPTGHSSKIERGPSEDVVSVVVRELESIPGNQELKVSAANSSIYTESTPLYESVAGCGVGEYGRLCRADINESVIKASLVAFPGKKKPLYEQPTYRLTIDRKTGHLFYSTLTIDDTILISREISGTCRKAPNKPKF